MVYCLELHEDKDFAPVGLDEPYRIICRNNPLIYVDPSGNLFIIDDILIGAAIGAAIGGITKAPKNRDRKLSLRGKAEAISFP